MTSDPLQLVYKSVLSVGTDPSGRRSPAEDPQPGPWHFLTLTVFQAQCGVFVPRQDSGYFGQRFNVSGEFLL